ncbi:AraC family transcriptional regulator [Caldimonas sp. KR1-144]|uniref:AraC family transcriptional regulator n=1 Tax=Caldimonas sp. KR1-144 TaxID=3400911 RepID=UPI003C094242
MPRRPQTAARGPVIGPLTPMLFAPTRERPLRAKSHWLEADTQVEPHSHPWAQLAFSATGVMRLTADRGTYLVPPSRAVWIPPGVEHAITVVETCHLRTLYLHQAAGRCGPAVPRADEAAWRGCRVLEVSDLLRALVLALPTAPDGGEPPDAAELQRERLIADLLRDELRRARPVRLGVDLPRDKRLRALCEAVLDDPTRHATLADWSRDVGASERTVARLFRQDLGTSFVQWRQQVLLARALAMAARKQPMAQIAAELGYASPSAFSAMVRRSVGAPPSRFFASAG